VVVDERDDLLVDLAAEHHFHDFHRVGVGHPHAVDEFAALAELGEQLVDLRPAAVHHHGIQADQLHQHDVAREG
jgi:hypothetical protein